MRACCMHQHWSLLQAILALLCLSFPGALAGQEGTRCEVDRSSAPPRIEIRDEPDNSAHVLSAVKSNDAEFRALDIVSRGPKNNDWIKVRSAGLTGWVRAAGFQCRLSPEEAKTEISQETAIVIQALKRKDMNALAAYVHPVKGVRFSPSATVAAGANVVLAAQAVRQWLETPAKRVWGSDDATGAPIRLSPAEFYKKFIYSRDFAAAPIISFNSFAAKSTDRNNAWEAYPNALIVEYYFPPSSPGGNDWAGLRLVYEKHAGRWFLSGVIHDKWTI